MNPSPPHAQLQAIPPAVAAAVEDADVPTAARVLGASPFIAQVFAQQADWAADLLARGNFRNVQTVSAAQVLAQAPAGCDGDEAWMRELRRLRNREFARIAFRDLAGVAALDETLQALSAFADAAVDAACARAYAQLRARFGTPRAANGSAIAPIVLGMGKLGGGELNFSSDIDLIFGYGGAGETDGASSVSNEEFFSRMVQLAVKLLAQRTPDGFVFRVDTLLRPFGSASAPALPVDAMRAYYRDHGREWERYAMVKARPIAGDLAAGREFLNALKPFVYRPYLDFNSIDHLRELKHRIDDAARKSGADDDVKLGPGGIRELEFIVQLFQLMRGGQLPGLRDCRLRPVLRRLAPDLLPPSTVAALDEAYVFLRRCENAIQMYRDEQTHKLPRQDAPRAALCLALDLRDWNALLDELDSHRAIVREAFEHLFAEPVAASTLPKNMRDLWDAESADLPAMLQQLGFAQDTQALARSLEGLRQSPLVRRLDESGQARLRWITAALVRESLQQETPAVALARVLKILTALAGRSTYLALLRNGALARAQLVRLCAASPWIVDLLTQTPALLDILMDAKLSAAAPGREEMRERLGARAAGIAGDIELEMDLLRRFRQEMTLRIAAADLDGKLPLVQVSDRLTWLAEAIVEQTLAMAQAQVWSRLGVEPPGRNVRIAVIAYGKFGSLELGYGSDLDLVFVYDAPDDGDDDPGRPSASDVAARVAQRSVQLLSTMTSAGRAYEIDLELRPSGNSGLVVASLAGFTRYQRESAWTWEHQALLKARPVAGDPALCGAIASVRLEVLSRARDAQKLQRDVRDMRARMRASLDKKTPGRWSVKQARGGLVDAEFVTQYLCLRDAAEFPPLLEYTDNWRQLEALVRAGRIEPSDRDALLAAERAYRGFLHRRALQQQDAMADEAQFAEERAAVTARWQHWLENAE